MQYNHSELDYITNVVQKNAITTMAPTQERTSMFTGGKARRKQIDTKDARKCETGGVKKSHRYRPGILARSQISSYQKHTKIVLRKQVFLRLVDIIFYDIRIGMLSASLPYGILIDTPLEYKTYLRFDSSAVMALYEASKAFLAGLLQDFYQSTSRPKYIKKTRRKIGKRPYLEYLEALASFSILEERGFTAEF